MFNDPLKMFVPFAGTAQRLQQLQYNADDSTALDTALATWTQPASASTPRLTAPSACLVSVAPQMSQHQGISGGAVRSRRAGIGQPWH